MYYLYNKNPEDMLFGVCCSEWVIIDDYLLLNCGARLAAFKPYFFLSFILGSRVRKPSFLRIALYSGSA